MSDLRELLRDAAPPIGELDVERMHAGAQARRHRTRLAVATGAIVALVVVGTVAALGLAGDDHTSAPVIAPPTTVAVTVPPVAPTTAPSTTEPSTTIQPSASPSPGTLESFRLGYEGLGPIKLGMTFEEASAASGVEIAARTYEHGCGAAADMATGYVAGYDTRDRLVYVLRRNGRIVSLTNYASDLETISGIQIGSTFAEVMGTYANAIVGRGQQGNTAIRITDAAGRQVVFYFPGYDENPDAEVTGIAVDESRAAETFREALC